MKMLLATSAIFLLALLMPEAQAVDASANATSAIPTAQVFGDWVISCKLRAAGQKSCRMMQTLASVKLKRPVGVLTIGKDAAGKLRGAVRIPVGVSLAQGVLAGFDGKDPFVIPYSACHRIGCFAPFDLDEARLDKMRNASKFVILAQTVSKQAMNLNFSTRGFASAYDAYLNASR